MKLNGDALAKKVVDAFEKGDIIIHFNKEFQSNIKSVPSTIPFLVTKVGNDQKVFVFASSFMKNITSSSEYRNLLTVMEAGYLALNLVKHPNKFTMNRSLMQKMCWVYTIMTTSPMEQRLYMKGENLTKAMLYTIAYFYGCIDGKDSLDVASLPVKSIIADKIDGSSPAKLERSVEGSVALVAAGVEDHALAGSEPGGTVEARNGTLPQVGRVVGEEAASEIDSPLGCVEQLDPSCLLTVAVHHRRFVRNRHHLGDDEVRNVLGEGLEAQDNGCRRKK